MEPPRYTNLAAMGAMCANCYPGVATHENVLCVRCFDNIHRSMSSGAEVEFSHVATVESITRAVLPVRYQTPDMSHEAVSLTKLNPLHTGILLWGPSGHGKTYQASILARRAIAYATHSGPQRTTDFQWWSSAELLDQLRDRSKESNPLVEQLIAAKLLVIDDLGAEKPSEWVRERLYRIVNSRYEAVRSILVTTNMSPAQLEKQVGARITGRLMEVCEVLELRDVNHRIRGAA